MSSTWREVGWMRERRRLRSLLAGSLLQGIASSVERSGQHVVAMKRRDVQEPNLDNYKIKKNKQQQRCNRE